MSDGTELWIVGEWKGDISYIKTAEDGTDYIHDYGAWSFGGVFDSEEKAVAACRTPAYFVAPFTLNEAQPPEDFIMHGAYYPHLQTKDEATP